MDVFIEQYKYQFNTPKDVAALRKYRESVGRIDSYPAIEWFCILMDKKERERILEKDKVDNCFWQGLFVGLEVRTKTWTLCHEFAMRCRHYDKWVPRI